MKILHCADIHLGSKMEAKLPKDKSDERRSELCGQFCKMVEYAVNSGINIILLAGDVFDSDQPSKHDKEFFYSVIKGNPDIDFLYLRGNHDRKESYTEYDIKNLKTFSDKWTYYTYGDIDIYGLEMTDMNFNDLYSSFSANKNHKNIVMLHGQLSDREGLDMIALNRLKYKYIDYLALGHLHTHSMGYIDDRGKFSYPGCLEGRGFDETGEKGFVVIDTDRNMNITFIPFSLRIIEDLTVDISDCEDPYSALVKVKASIACTPEDMLRVTLTGQTEYNGASLCADVANWLKSDCYFASVRDKTVRTVNYSEYINEISLRGEFIRCVLQNNDYTDSEKTQIICAGLCALEGREPD